MGKAIARTSSRYPFDFANPDPRHVDIVDIALGLSKECRWNGQLPPDEFLSVAQHCVMASKMVPPHLQFEGLLHDGEEAYVRDLASPIKSLIPQYVSLAAGVTRAIRIRFDLPLDHHSPQVKDVDSELQRIEEGAIFGNGPKFDLWTPKQAFERFIERFNELYPAHLERLRERGVRTYHDCLTANSHVHVDLHEGSNIKHTPRESCTG
ncbi:MULTISPECIES: hypothetical protein [Achromobacter]|uniref:Uncharacterized protein n=1 Tax=Achromobacter mucicolens TaxID=1389922 RepID=A0ABM8LKJ6_9BURK|nr:MULTISPECIES: hypothetical protein [Achromobacter]AVG44105.1 hypothetical protein MC81_31990 [Achromobacter insolitus]CAB3847792.1 hypothetical protein LMG3410_01610 [Achromobacter aegrifaciens]CAB3912287.1 hypothetical protein LMG3415_05037 [Achromobacter mucicolens]